MDVHFGRYVSSRIQSGWTALMLVAQLGNINLTKLFLENGAAVDIQNNVSIPFRSCSIKQLHMKYFFFFFYIFECFEGRKIDFDVGREAGSLGGSRPVAQSGCTSGFG